MELTHIDKNGNAVMVDITGKAVAARNAVATGRIRMHPDCFSMVAQGRMQKGDVLAVAQIAGIQGAKQTAGLIPLCHQITLTKCAVEFALHEKSSEVEAICTVCCEGKTGAEMEALTGAGIALLTVYDMCKAVDKSMVIHDIHLISKQGGKSGAFHFAGTDKTNG